MLSTVDIPAAEAAVDRCTLCGKNPPGEPCVRSPCGCPAEVQLHRSCLERRLASRQLDGGVCSRCGRAYPTRKRCLPMWRWLWDRETRWDAVVFLANLIFSFANAGVLSLAWLFVLVTCRGAWVTTAALSSILTMFSLFWLTFGYARFLVLYRGFLAWRKAHTTWHLLDPSRW